MSVNDLFIACTAELRPGEKRSLELAFAHEIGSPKLGDGDVFHGECIPAVLDTVLRRGGAPGGVPVAFTPLRGEPANVH